LVKVSADLDVEWAKTKTTRQEYLDKMHAHITHVKHTLGLYKLLGEKKVLLDEKEQDLELQEAALAEAQAQGLNPWDNWEELTELVEFQKHLDEVEVARVAEAGQLVVLVDDISMVLVETE
jgi:hypothetical protein